jgi:hypothetical protein
MLSWFDAHSGYLGSEKRVQHESILINSKARVTQFGVSTVSKSVKLRIVSSPPDRFIGHLAGLGFWGGAVHECRAAPHDTSG